MRRFTNKGSWPKRVICGMEGHAWRKGPTGRADGWWGLTGKDRGWGGFTMRRSCQRCGIQEYGNHNEEMAA